MVVGKIEKSGKKIDALTRNIEVRARMKYWLKVGRGLNRDPAVG